MSVTDEEVSTFINARRLSSRAHEEARKVIALLYVAVQAIPELSIARRVVAGSYAKRTALTMDWDIDLVLLLNLSKLQDLPDVREGDLQRLSHELGKIPGLHVLKVNRFVIKCQFNGFNFDFLVGVNASNGIDQSTLSSRERSERQKVKLLNCVRQQIGAEKDLSTSFTEFSVSFVTKQPAVVIDGILLCKIWTKHNAIILEVSKAGGCPRVFRRFSSYGVELICIHLFNKLPKRLNSPLAIFEQFLQLLARCDTTHHQVIEFNDNYDPEKWRHLRETSSAPLQIFDPVIPLDDVVSKFDEWPQLAFAARRTLLELKQPNTSLKKVFFPRVSAPACSSLIPRMRNIIVVYPVWLSPLQYVPGALSIKVERTQPALQPLVELMQQLCTAKAKIHGNSRT